MLPIIFPIIAASGDVTSIIGSNPVRFYPHGEAPQNVQAPYCTWFVVSGIPENCLGEVPRIDSFSVQIDCWSDNNGEGSQDIEILARAIRDTLEPEMHMTNVLINSVDQETKRHRIGLQFTVWQDRDEYS